MEPSYPILPSSAKSRRRQGEEMNGFDIGRFSLFFEKHIGFGIRWSKWRYPLEVSVALPFVTMTFGFGSFKP